MIDEDLIHEKFDIIEKNLKFLKKEGQKVPKDYKTIQAIKYSLLEMIESCIRISNHLIAGKGFERPQDYAEMFEILGKHDVLSNELAKKMSLIVKFRDVLLHRHEADDSKVIEIVKKELDDFKDFMKCIIKYMGG